MKKSAAVLAASALLFTPTLALAHPGHGESISAGFLHPFTGVDHLLALASLGVLAAQLAPKRALSLVGGFLAAFTLAFAAAQNGLALPAQEGVLAASLLGMGALVMMGRRLPFALSLAVTMLFAAYHGVAHGSELGAFAATTSLTGFFIASLVLTGGAYAAGRQLAGRTERAALGYRSAAACLASCTGLLLLAGM